MYRPAYLRLHISCDGLVVFQTTPPLSDYILLYVRNIYKITTKTRGNFLGIILFSCQLNANPIHVRNKMLTKISERPLILNLILGSRVTLMFG